MHKSLTWLSDHFKNSVAQVLVEEAIYDFRRPYRSPAIQRITGSSFVIAIQNTEIYLLTNAHVVENAITIKLRFLCMEKEEIPCKVVAFCPYRDLSLLKINKQNSEAIIKKNIVIPDFTDSLQVDQGDRVIVAGYSLDEENIQFVSGDVSGFYSPYNLEEEKKSLAYIQITAPINHGNSGSPVFNSKGSVIGIVTSEQLKANKIGCVISSRTIFSVLYEMIQMALKENYIMMYKPTLGFDWNPSSKEKGIYIRRVYPNSSLNGDITYNDLRKKSSSLIQMLNIKQTEGDIALTIKELIDSYKRVNDTFNKSYLTKGDILSQIRIPNITTFDVPSLFRSERNLSDDFLLLDINTYGQVTIRDQTITYGQVTTRDQTITRKLSLQEVEDMIPVGLILRATVIREDNNGDIFNVNIGGEYKPTYTSVNMIRKIYPKYEQEKLDYMIFAGMLIVELSENLNFNNRINKFDKYVVISEVFDSAKISNFRTIKAGDILRYINGIKIRTLTDVRRIVQRIMISEEETITLIFKNKVLINLNVMDVVLEDKELFKRYDIK